MAPLQPAPLRVVQSSRVSPPPGSVPDEASLPFTFKDVIWISDHAVERVFFYRFPHLLTSHFMESALPDLKSSLSLTLGHFYPLAGRIRRGLDSRYEIHFVAGDSVAFTVVECNHEDFDELSGNRPRDVTRLRPLVPQLPRSADAQPLLTIQVTVFPDSGVAIGVTLHHAACDGSSSAHFLSSWAACCRSGGSASPALAPLFDRTLIPDPRGLYSIYDKAFSRKPGASKEDAGEASGDMVMATFTFAGDQIKRLKELVLAKAAPESFHCSSITVAFSHAWVCLVKTRGYETERNCVLAFVANVRSRLSPPLPAEYFGNCLSLCIVEAKAGDLAESGGLPISARAIGKSVEEFKNLPDPLEAHPLERVARAMSQQPLTVAGSPQLKVYDIDFGWGRPRKVEVVSIAGSGAMSVAESGEGGGGLEIGFALPKHEMDEFTAHFNSGLEDLLQ